MTTEHQRHASAGHRGHGWRGTVVQAALLMGLWLILSGRVDFFHLAMGFFSVAVVMTINYRLTHAAFFRDDLSEWEHIKMENLLRFVPALGLEIVEGSLQVASAVLHPRMPIEPVLLRVRVKLPTVGARVLLGNVITLTPGSVTLGIDDDRFLIHALRGSSVSSIVDGTIPKQVAQLFGIDEGELISSVQVIETSEEM